MNLLEYQAKQLFRQVGIPVLPSQTISHPSQLKQLTIPYPIVIKSQVYAGGRGKAGGIKFVDNTIDAIAAARSIFNLPIAGEYPEVLLAESQYDADRELFFAILLDYELQCPVIFGSSQGGIDIEQLLNNLQKVEITDDFSAFYARRLAIRMGLESDLIEKIVDVIEKMYHLFITKDLDLIEINPLGISANKEVMALDGRVRVNDDALGRHPDLLSVTLSDKNNQPPFSARHKLELASALNTPTLLDWQDERGKIAIITNSFDEAVLTWDWLSQAKGKPNRVWLVGESSNGQILPDTVLIKQLITAMTEAPTIGAIKVVLINILLEENQAKIIQQELIKYFQLVVNEDKLGQGEDRELIPTGNSSRANRQRKTSQKGNKVSKFKQLKWVIRLNIKNIDNSLSNNLVIHWTTSLHSAIKEAINLAKSR